MVFTDKASLEALQAYSAEPTPPKRLRRLEAAAKAGRGEKGLRTELKLKDLRHG